MNDRKDREIIQVALDTTLSGLQDDPWLARKVLDDAKGEVKVKKKISVGLVLALVLILVALGALAVTFSDVFFKTAGSLQSDKGNLNQWSLEDKINLIEAMRESGIDISVEKYAALVASTTDEEEANRLSNEIIVESKLARESLAKKYGFTYDTFSYFTQAISFEENVNTPEESQWIVSYRPLKHEKQIGNYEVRVSAASGDVLETAWSLDNIYSSSKEPDNWHASVWKVELIDRLLTFRTAYDQKREEMETTLGDFATWSIANKAKLDEVYFIEGYPIDDEVLNVLPGEKDISEKEAILFAKNCICEKYGTDISYLNTYEQQKSFFLLQGQTEKLWVIEFHSKEADEKYVVEFCSPSKDIISCAHYIRQVRVEPFESKSIYKESSDIGFTDKEAVTLAWEVMKNTYGFSDEVFGYFDANVTLEADMFTVTFHANHYNPRKIGTYVITINSKNKMTEASSWDLEEAYTKQGRCEPWKSADLWSSYEYNKYVQLRNATKAIIQEAGDQWSMTFEQQAAYDALYRKAGYDRKDYYHGEPGTMDIPLEKAISIAKQSIISKYNLESNQLDDAKLLYEFDVSDETLYRWRIRLHTEANDTMYKVEIDSRNGSIIHITKQIGSN